MSACLVVVEVVDLFAHPSSKNYHKIDSAKEAARFEA